jgi:hypothetical protein
MRGLADFEWPASAGAADCRVAAVADVSQQTVDNTQTETRAPSAASAPTWPRAGCGVKAPFSVCRRTRVRSARSRALIFKFNNQEIVCERELQRATRVAAWRPAQREPMRTARSRCRGHPARATQTKLTHHVHVVPLYLLSTPRLKVQTYCTQYRPFNSLFLFLVFCGYTKSSHRRHPKPGQPHRAQTE